MIVLLRRLHAHPAGRIMLWAFGGSAVAFVFTTRAVERFIENFEEALA